MVAQVLSPHGLQGELKCRLVTEFPDRFRPRLKLYLGRQHTPTTLVGSRLAGDGEVVYLRLRGITDRESAEALRGQDVQVAMRDAVPLPEGRFFFSQVIGLRVEDEEGQHWGDLVDILETAANHVYVVHGPKGELLLPAVDDVLIAIEPERGRVLVRLLPGMAPEPTRAARRSLGGGFRRRRR